MAIDAKGYDPALMYGAKITTGSANSPEVALANTHIFVGDSSDNAQDVAMSGDATISNAGAVTIGSSAISTAKIADAAVTGAKLVTTKGYFSVATKTNGTTPVNVFGSTNGFVGSITSVIAIAQDATAGSVSLIKGEAGVDTNIAHKIEVNGGLGSVKGTVVAITGFSSTGTMQVVSNTAGNSIVVATFTVA